MLVESWQKDDESFYETKGSELVYNKVKGCTCILVTSSSGLGKTATIRHIAFKFKREGYEIVPVESPEDILNYNTTKNQVFLIDDVLGKYDLSMIHLERWERLNEKLLSCLKTKLGSKKILCTLRLQIALQIRFRNASTILNSEVINLEHEPIALSKVEKQKILMKHLSRSNLDNEITTPEIDIMCKTNYSFPLLCKLVANNEERFQNRIALFRQPLLLLKEELDKISNENKKLYCILVLCMLFNGSFSRSIFDIYSYTWDQKIYRIMQSCGLQRNMSKKELEESALSAIGSYFISHDTYKFQFIHDTLEETIGCHYYMFDPRVMFSECDILFIRDRIRMHSTENTYGNINENIVNIREDDLNEDCFRPLFNRLKTELLNGRFSNLLMCQLFDNRNFVCIFGKTFDEGIYTLMKKCSSEKVFSKVRRVGDALKCMYNAKVQEQWGAISLVKENRHLGVGNTLLDWTVAFGCYELFRLAWNKMTTFQRKMILGRYSIKLSIEIISFLHLAILGGSFEIVADLVCHGANVNFSSCFFEPPLYTAISIGRYDMVRLLLRHGAQVNLRDLFDHVATTKEIDIISNKQQVNSLINAYIEDDINQTELHKAVRHNDLEQLRSNIRPENINLKTKRGLTALHYAVLLNNLEAVKVFFHQEKSKPKVNIGDKNGLTAVHQAVIINNIEILSILLRYKADVKVLDDIYRTPLHYTTNEKATRLLLNYYAQKKCSESLRNEYSKKRYKETPMSAFLTTCFNITLQTAFRFVLRDFVNFQDKNGNTPLHSVIERHLVNQGSIDLIETLVNNGANPYLFNNRSISAVDIIEKCEDTDNYLPYLPSNVKHGQLIQNFHKMFASVTFLFAISFLLFFYFLMIFEDSKNELHCVGEGAESGNITLVQVTRSFYMLLTIVLFWSLSFITFEMRYSVVQLQSILLLVLLGSSFFIVWGEFLFIQPIKKFEYISSMVFWVVMYRLTLEYFRYFIEYMITIWQRLPVSVLQVLLLCILIMSNVVAVLSNDQTYYYNFSTRRVIYTLNMTALNCSKFTFVNILCTSLDYNITYRHDVDFTIQCRTDPNITSSIFNGTLIVESEFIDWSEICIISIFLSHAICTCCFLHCISILGKRKLHKKQGRVTILAIAIVFQPFAVLKY